MESITNSSLVKVIQKIWGELSTKGVYRFYVYLGYADLWISRINFIGIQILLIVSLTHQN